MFATLPVLAAALTAVFLDVSDGSHMGDWGWGGWLGMSIMMVLVWGGILALGFLLVRVLSDRPNTSTTSALDIARERYARGELSDEEFLRIRQDLAR